jgi:hypothetical protein
MTLIWHFSNSLLFKIYTNKFSSIRSIFYNLGDCHFFLNLFVYAQQMYLLNINYTHLCGTFMTCNILYLVVFYIIRHWIVIKFFKKVSLKV